MATDRLDAKIYEAWDWVIDSRAENRTAVLAHVAMADAAEATRALAVIQATYANDAQARAHEAHALTMRLVRFEDATPDLEIQGCGRRDTHGTHTWMAGGGRGEPGAYRVRCPGWIT